LKGEIRARGRLAKEFLKDQSGLILSNTVIREFGTEIEMSWWKVVTILTWKYLSSQWGTRLF